MEVVSPDTTWPSGQVSPHVQQIIRASWEVERMNSVENLKMNKLDQVKLMSFLNRRLIHFIFMEVTFPPEADHQVYYRQKEEEDCFKADIVDHIYHPNIFPIILKYDWGEPWCPTWQTVDFCNDTEKLFAYYKKHGISKNVSTTPSSVRLNKPAHNSQLWRLGFEKLHIDGGSKVWIRGVESTFDRMIDLNQYPETLPHHSTYFQLYKRYRKELRNLENEYHVQLGLSNRMVKALNDTNFTPISVYVILHRLKMVRKLIPIINDNGLKVLQDSVETTRKRPSRHSQSGSITAKQLCILEQFRKAIELKKKNPELSSTTSRILRDLALSDGDYNIEEKEDSVEEEEEKSKCPVKENSSNNTGDSDDEIIVIRRKRKSSSETSSSGTKKSKNGFKIPKKSHDARSSDCLSGSGECLAKKVSKRSNSSKKPYSSKGIDVTVNQDESQEMSSRLSCLGNDSSIVDFPDLPTASGVTSNQDSSVTNEQSTLPLVTDESVRLDTGEKIDSVQDDSDAMSLVDSDDEVSVLPEVLGSSHEYRPQQANGDKPLTIEYSNPFISHSGVYPTYPVNFSDNSFGNRPPFWWYNHQYVPPPRMVQDLETGQICFINPFCYFTMPVSANQLTLPLQSRH